MPPQGGSVPHKTLDFTSSKVQIAIWDSTQALRRGLEQDHLEAREVWVNVTILSPYGVAKCVYHRLCGRKPNGVPPVEQPPSTHQSAELSVAMLRRIYMSEDGSFKLPRGGIYHHNTHSVPFGRNVLLVTCVGFTDPMVAHQVTTNMSSSLWLLLRRLQQK